MLEIDGILFVNRFTYTLKILGFCNSWFYEVANFTQVFLSP